MGGSLRNKILSILIGAAVLGSSAATTASLVARARPDAGAPGGTSAASARAPVADEVASQAAALAAAMRALPVRDGDPSDDERYCPAERIRVSWDDPGEAYRYGAHLEPLGPVPGPDATAVNGIVHCEGSTYAYVGFEAIRSGATWQVLAVPDFGGEEDGHNDLDAPEPPDPGLVARATPPSPARPDAATGPQRRPAAPGAAGPVPTSPAGALTAAIEPYASYDPQDTCDPRAKPGVVAFRTLLLERYPGTGNLGIVRNCSIGGRSEHKEGRAFDWRVNVNKPAERAAAERLLAWLFETDRFGNRHAMVRRLGIMYVVWNKRIWGAYRADQGWRAYSGASPHTDHVHFSWSWPGAKGITSFWTGVPAAMPAAPRYGERTGPRDVSPREIALRRERTPSDLDRRDADRALLREQAAARWRAWYEQARAERAARREALREWWERRRRASASPSPSPSPSPPEAVSPVVEPPPEPEATPSSAPSPGIEPASRATVEPSPSWRPRARARMRVRGEPAEGRRTWERRERRARRSSFAPWNRFSR